MMFVVYFIEEMAMTKRNVIVPMYIIKLKKSDTVLISFDTVLLRRVRNFPNLSIASG